MSYCRFENTYADLQDCEEALDADGVAGTIEDANEYEAPYVKRLIKLCKRIAERYGDEIDE